MGPLSVRLVYDRLRGDIVTSDKNSPSEKRPMGSLEAEVLRSLWTHGAPMTPGEVHDEVGDGLAYTTVMTILTRLWAKGLVSRERSGRAYAYSPTISEADHAAQRMRRPLAEVSDRNAALSRFVHGLSKKDSAALRRLLDTQNRK